MKVFYLLLFVLATQTSAYSQSPSLLSLNQLEKRVKDGKDTVYVINFWATWCGPCVKELPNFEKFNREYGRKEKMKVLLVSVDFISNLKSSVIPFVKKRQLKSEIYLLNEKDQQKYIGRVDSSWSGTIPATLFIKGTRRRFVEKEFSYLALEKEYQNFK